MIFRKKKEKNLQQKLKKKSFFIAVRVVNDDHIEIICGCIILGGKKKRNISFSLLFFYKIC